MDKRRSTSYIPLGEVHPFGVKLLVNIMKRNNIPYDCELFDVTKHLGTYMRRDLENKRLWTTGEVIKTLNHIRENKLLG